MEPVILDIFTSAKGSPRRKNVFSPGESIQWNVIHTVRDGDFIGRQYRIYWHCEYWSNLYYFSEGHDVEFVFPPKVVNLDNFTYRFDTHHTSWWYDSIPFQPVPRKIRFDGYDDTLGKFARGEFDLVFNPGFWKFTAYVRMTEADSGSPFGVLSDWHYLIHDPQG